MDISKIEMSMIEQQKQEELKEFDDEEAQSTYELNTNAELMNQTLNQKLNDTKLIKTQRQKQEKTMVTDASIIFGQNLEAGVDINLELDSDLY